jgi:hypothetical protein
VLSEERCGFEWDKDLLGSGAIGAREGFSEKPSGPLKDDVQFLVVIANQCLLGYYH